MTFKHVCEIVWAMGFVALALYLLRHEFKSRPAGQRKRYVAILLVSFTWPFWLALVALILGKAKPGPLAVVSPAATPDGDRRRRGSRQ